MLKRHWDPIRSTHRLSQSRAGPETHTMCYLCHVPLQSACIPLLRDEHHKDWIRIPPINNIRHSPSVWSAGTVITSSFHVLFFLLRTENSTILQHFCIQLHILQRLVADEVFVNTLHHGGGGTQGHPPSSLILCLSLLGPSLKPSLQSVAVTSAVFVHSPASCSGLGRVCIPPPPPTQSPDFFPLCLTCFLPVFHLSTTVFLHM